MENKSMPAEEANSCPCKAMNKNYTSPEADEVYEETEVEIEEEIPAKKKN